MGAALTCDSEEYQPGAITSFLFDVPISARDLNGKRRTTLPTRREPASTAGTLNKAGSGAIEERGRYFHLLSDLDLLELRPTAEIIVQRASEIVSDLYRRYVIHLGNSGTLAEDEFTRIIKDALQRSQSALLSGDIDAYAVEVSRLGELLAVQHVTLNEVIALLQLLKESVRRVLPQQDRLERLATAFDKLTHVQIVLLVAAYSGTTCDQKMPVLQGEAARLPDAQEARFHRLIGATPNMRQLYRRIEAAAASRGNLLIVGESGSGKELVARAVHECSGRGGRPFVALNCAALPKDLIESELFGYKRALSAALRTNIPGCSAPQMPEPCSSTKSRR
jgi:transcriptional regulator of acetoin/glycerol metabolism